MTDLDFDAPAKPAPPRGRSLRGAWVALAATFIVAVISYPLMHGIVANTVALFSGKSESVLGDRVATGVAALIFASLMIWYNKRQHLAAPMLAASLMGAVFPTAYVLAESGVEFAGRWWVPIFGASVVAALWAVAFKHYERFGTARPTDPASSD